MNEQRNLSGTIFEEQGELIVREQLMDSYWEGTICRDRNNDQSKKLHHEE